MPTVAYAEGDLPANSRRVFDALGDLAIDVPIDGWCLIGGLMVEVVLRSRGRQPLRPTDDGDVVGDVRVDRDILATISSALLRASFELVETGMDGIAYWACGMCLSRPRQAPVSNDTYANVEHGGTVLAADRADIEALAAHADRVAVEAM